MTNTEPVGRFIRRRRLELMMSQESLAELVGVTPKTVIRWEAGTSEPSARKQSPLAKHLRVPLSELQRPRPHEDEYKSLEERIAALEVATFGKTQAQ